MANKKVKYIVALVLMTLFLFVVVVVCFVIFIGLSSSIRYGKVDYRLGNVQREESWYGPDRLLDELYYSEDYEEEFDSYWDFANIKVAYIRGRYASDPSKDIETIENYIKTCTDERRLETATQYLNNLK